MSIAAATTAKPEPAYNSPSDGEAAPRHKIMRTWVNALTRRDLDRIVREAINSKSRLIVGNHNLHSLYLYYADTTMRRFYEHAKYVHVDGMSIVFLAKLLKLPITREHRTGYMDWYPKLMGDSTEHRWRVFYLGSKPEVLTKGISVIRQRWPGIEISGHHGYFNKVTSHEENHSVLEAIRQFCPNILLVGMGMPLQERWILENSNDLEANVVLACGAMLDYVAGAIPLPPRWLGRIGLEWLFRLCSEPKRLWRRYLIEPLSLIYMALTYKDH